MVAILDFQQEKKRKVEFQGGGHLGFLFACVEVLRPSQPNGVMLSVVSYSNHTLTGQA